MRGDTRFEATRTIFRVGTDGAFDSLFADNGRFVEVEAGPTFGEGLVEGFRITDDGSLLVLEEDRVRRFNV